MPLAKSVEVTQPQPQPTSPMSQSDGVMSWEGVPVDLFRFFNVDLGTTPEKDIKEIKEIYRWARNEGDTMGNILQKISYLENRLGSPDFGQKRYSKMYNWVRIQDVVNKILRPSGIEQELEDLKKQQQAYEKK